MISLVQITGLEKNFGQGQEGLKLILNLADQERSEIKKMSYEGKMARNSLRKAIAYSTELLSMITPTDELEPWVQAKINDMDHYIEAVYGYYKFGESMDESSDSTKEYEQETYMSSDGQITVGDYTTKHFDICPSAQKLYSSIKDKTVNST